MKFVNCFGFVKIGAVDRLAAAAVACTVHTGWGLRRRTEPGSASSPPGKSLRWACTGPVAAGPADTRCSGSTGRRTGSAAAVAESADCTRWPSPCNIAAVAATGCCTVGILDLGTPFDTVSSWVWSTWAAVDRQAGLGGTRAPTT